MKEVKLTTPELETVITALLDKKLFDYNFMFATIYINDTMGFVFSPCAENDCIVDRHAATKFSILGWFGDENPCKSPMDVIEASALGTD